MIKQFKPIMPIIGYILLFVSLANAQEYTILVLPAFILFLLLTDTFSIKKLSKNEKGVKKTNPNYIAIALKQLLAFFHWSVIIGMTVGLFYSIAVEKIYLHYGEIDKREFKIGEPKKGYVSVSDIYDHRIQNLYPVNHGKYYKYFDLKSQVAEYFEPVDLEFLCDEAKMQRDQIKASIIENTLYSIIFPTMAGVFILLCLFTFVIISSNWIKSNS